MRISAEDQADAVRQVFDFYGDRLRVLAMDKTGNGLPLWQMLDPLQGRNVHEHLTALAIEQPVGLATCVLRRAEGIGDGH